MCQFIKPWRLGLQRKFYSIYLFYIRKKYISRVAFCRWGWKGRSEVMNCIYMFHFSSVKQIKTDVIILWLSCIAKTTLLMPWRHREPRAASTTMGLTLLSQNKTYKTETHVYGTCEHLCLMILTLVVLNLFTKYKIMFILSVILTIDVALGIFIAYTARSLPLWTLVAENPGIQGARALTATVLTQLSRNLSVSAPEGLRIVYITCRVSRYHDILYFFYYHIA